MKRQKPITTVAAWLAACPLIHIAPFTSTFALLDVKKGRKALAKTLAVNEHSPIPHPVRVVILGTLQDGRAWSHDDGTSIEFAVDVEHVYQVLP